MTTQITVGSEPQTIYLLSTASNYAGVGMTPTGAFATLEGAQAGHGYVDKDGEPLSFRWEETTLGVYFTEVGNLGVTLYIRSMQLRP